MFFQRKNVEEFCGLMHRQRWFFVLCFAVLFAVPVIITAALRPAFTATALVVISPAPADLLGSAVFGSTEAPQSTLVDGAVELMRSEPVLQRALALAAPVNPIDFPASIDLRQKVLAFFGSRPAPIMTDAQILKAARPNVTINRRGLTPVIAISVRSASPAFAARFANAIALAHIDEEGLAKAEAVAEAGRLVEAQVSAIEVAIADIERDHQLVLSSGSEIGIASSLEALQRQRHILQLRADNLALQASLQLPDSRLAAPASVPVDASFPDLRTTSLIAALFAATIAMGATIAVDGWADGMRSTTELAALVGGPIAIAMPKLKARRLDGTSHADQVVKAPLSPLSQAMRSLQVSLSQSFAESASPVIAVMSAAEGEGKTTTALGMARAFAMTGQRVLLIDADMRSPALR